jgi:hypothetical protein
MYALRRVAFLPELAVFAGATAPHSCFDPKVLPSFVRVLPMGFLSIFLSAQKFTEALPWRRRDLQTK